MRPKKICSEGELVRYLARERRGGRRVVFTNGCFDVLHVGHVRYLQKAKALGDVLVVALNTDASVRKLKGPGRPLNPLAARAEVLAALECVDFVTSFKEGTPERVIRLIKPDFLVKGGDWPKDRIAGAKFVESYGGKVFSIKFVKGFSTTGLIHKVTGENSRVK